MDEHGFIIAVPDIVKLEPFCFVFETVMKELMQKSEIRNYPIKRPEQAIVYHPCLAGFLMLKNIHDTLKKKINSNYSDVVYAIDLFHYDYEWKSGKASKNRASIYKGYLRIKPNIDLEKKASDIKEFYKNIVFQRQLLLNLFELKPELDRFYNLLSTREYEYFFKNWEGDFKPDAITYFREQEEKYKGERKAMSEDNDKQKIPKSLELLVYKLIQSYVFGKLESKHQLKWDESMKGNERGKDYSERKEKIAKDAFLAIRSRKDKEDFITYFTSTICSVSQRLGEEGYTTLAEVLYDDKQGVGWEKIRALSMLALSANS